MKLNEKSIVPAWKTMGEVGQEIHDRKGEGTPSGALPSAKRCAIGAAHIAAHAVVCGAVVWKVISAAGLLAFDFSSGINYLTSYSLTVALFATPALLMGASIFARQGSSSPLSAAAAAGDATLCATVLGLAAACQSVSLGILGVVFGVLSGLAFVTVRTRRGPTAQ